MAAGRSVAVHRFDLEGLGEPALPDADVDCFGPLGERRRDEDLHSFVLDGTRREHGS